MLTVQPMVVENGTDMFVANFTINSRSKNLGIKVSLLDYLIYKTAPNVFMKRFNKRFTNDFSKFNFEGVNYYGKK